MFSHSIRTKLTGWYVGLLGVVLILFSILLYFFLSNRLYESVDNSLKVSAVVVSRSATMKFSQYPLPGLENFFEQILGRGNLNKFYRIYDGSGNIGSRSKNLTASQFPLSQGAYANALKGETTYETTMIDGDHPIRIITMPLMHNDKLANLVQVGTSLKSVQETLKNLKIFVFTAVPTVLLLATLMGRFLAGRALKPVSKITQTAREIALGADLSSRIPVPEVHDEIGQLALTFNSMMDRLDRNFQQMRQFSSDASHELRTPLTVLKGQSELVLGKERNLEEYQDVLSSNLEEINYMSKVLEDLFLLSRSDEHQVQLNYKEVNLQNIIEEVCRHAEVIAMEKQIAIVTAYLEPLTITGDPVRLRQMVWNIIYNGVKYTPNGGEVKVSLEDKGEHALLVVQDTGIGIAQDHLPFIFDRFYRVDKARSRKEGGSGLGLSICKFIVQAHLGTIEVESEVGSGSKFKIALPKSPALQPVQN
ncbi:MAG: heavy metal sensor histidine kinase [Candidatus Nitrohelix vancouverensis]|uniref:histidine kinase n=1 Tax=Candidatus Nitrohelix vancouverensis TaxID=2705534 RepID=A0A7T0G4E9_9BACT|nr:MAG: heavy metal sensor histidine kinase [Candidatus Nitrohelix vancouverensis]